jgi:hypothetical protein
MMASCKASSGSSGSLKFWLVIDNVLFLPHGFDLSQHASTDRWLRVPNDKRGFWHF